MTNLFDLIEKADNFISNLGYLRRNIEDFKPYWEKRKDAILDYSKKITKDITKPTEIIFNNKFESLKKYRNSKTSLNYNFYKTNKVKTLIQKINIFVEEHPKLTKQSKKGIENYFNEISIREFKELN